MYQQQRIFFHFIKLRVEFPHMSTIKKLLISFSCVFTCLNFYTVQLSNDFYTEEENRGLVFPVFTVLQFAVGLAVPAQIPNRTVLVNLGVLSNLPLPNKINQLYPYVGKGRHITHNYLYESFANAWNWNDSNGTECIMKTICQVSSLNSRGGELIFDVLRLIFSPSSLKYPVAETHYMVAEQLGKISQHMCAEMYPLCDRSIIDMIVD